MIFLRASVFAASLAIVLIGSGAAIAAAPCTEINTPADLNRIRNNLSGNYCLAKDIDMTNVANFAPIGPDSFRSFLGTIDGRGHVIRNLKITSNAGFVGLFGHFEGTAKNLGLVDVKIRATAGKYVGALAGEYSGFDEPGTRISNCYSTGSVELVALDPDDGLTVRVGGLVGFVTTGTIDRSYSTASVRAASPDFPVGEGVGGLVGYAGVAEITRSFAAGAVRGSGGTAAGGLIGVSGTTNVSQSYALGPVSNGPDGATGGLIGRSNYNVAETYAAGRVKAEAGPLTFVGGLIGRREDGPVTASYWDKQTTRQATSGGGLSKTTAQLRAGLPPGFSASRGGSLRASAIRISSTCPAGSTARLLRL